MWRDRCLPPFKDCGSVVSRHRAMVDRTEGRRPENRPSDKGGLTQNFQAGIPKRQRPDWHTERKRYTRNSVGGPKTPVCGGEGTQGPWRRGATDCSRLSRQLLACGAHLPRPCLPRLRSSLAVLGCASLVSPGMETAAHGSRAACRKEFGHARPFPSLTLRTSCLRSTSLFLLQATSTSSLWSA